MPSQFRFKLSLNPRSAQDCRHRFRSIMPHSTAPAASATGTPAPIEGAGAPTRQERLGPQVGMAWAAVATNTKDPLANAKNFIAASRQIFDL
jgi:hypothetical protein